MEVNKIISGNRPQYTTVFKANTTAQTTGTNRRDLAIGTGIAAAAVLASSVALIRGNKINKELKQTLEKLKESENKTKNLENKLKEAEEKARKAIEELKKQDNKPTVKKNIR